MVFLQAFPDGFEDLMTGKGMDRSDYGRRATCEASLSVDVREWHRQGFLRPAGLRFSHSWTRNGMPWDSIDVRLRADAVVLTIKGGSKRKSAEQRVPLEWTRCHLGGVRPWFRCSASVGGRPCGRRVAKLFWCGTSVFGCRQCCGLVYRSQGENPRHRSIGRAQKTRMRLGGSANLAEPLPERPRGMHWQTYHRLLGRAMAAQERYLGMEIDHMRRRYPEPNRGL
jgi:hypothetical protein